MTKRTLILLSLAVGLMIFIYLNKPTHLGTDNSAPNNSAFIASDPTPSALVTAQPNPSNEPAQAQAGQSGSGDTDTHAQSSPGKDLRQIPIPQTAEIKKQVINNPHDTPKALVDFAVQMAPAMEQALSSPDKADEVFAFMEDCAQDKLTSETPASSQLVCLNNAYRIAKAHGPRFEQRLSKLVEAVSPYVRKLYEHMRSEN